ncbi:hypothetical protein SAMN04490190_3197 [Pseudomonas libanensis]|nr:hypothetical protein SAMN04490190_3197 [Pseudomonas libanensis]
MWLRLEYGSDFYLKDVSGGFFGAYRLGYALLYV